ncbi:CTB family bacteriocin [Scytonema sp. NUACC26]|uniref:CTB family bacteriocin n=1 Tax=Scytonema sp. NUACC26 TaxID=3140176 RepID=UPI0034DBE71A
MSNSMMQSNFLVDLSVEQEETIAGGLSIGSIDGIDLDSLTKTKFSEKKLATVSTVKSGRDGGEVTRIVGASDTNSFASELFNINV